MIDQFEWDINCKKNDPELFAEHLVKELGLGLEFITAISHSIREQIYNFAKSLVVADYSFDGSQVKDDELSCLIMPLVCSSSIVRLSSEVDIFGPKYVNISQSESEKMERDNMRDIRYFCLFND